MGNANRHVTELERIQSAEEAAKNWLLANVPPERLEKLGWGQLVSDRRTCFS